MIDPEPEMFEPETVEVDEKENKPNSVLNLLTKEEEVNIE